MSDTITVAEYCKRHNTSTQAVYAKIKRGTIQSTIVNGLKKVVDDTPGDLQPELQTETNEFTTKVEDVLNSVIKEQRKEIKRLHKTIKRLEDERFKDLSALRDVFMNRTPLLTTTDDVIDLAPIKKSKKKKKKKRK